MNNPLDVLAKQIIENNRFLCQNYNRYLSGDLNDDESARMENLLNCLYSKEKTCK